MTLRAYIWGMRIISLFLLAALGMVVAFVDPESSGWMGIALFYSVAFLALSGLFNLFLISIRKKIIGAEAAAENIGLSFRQGMLLAIIIIILLLLKSFEMLIWWDALIVVGAVFLIELYFLSRD